ncbi:MAG TPA: ABC transporter substrate-binding protein, partial [Candidatus Dormibacteraeota bacterium]|nr:ABC transporter substrate-binding protein [Candidatus Dormibacteraeota bacterium]
MSGRSSPRPLLSLLVAVALIAVTACVSPTSPAPTSASTSASPSADEIRVGAVFPLDGNAAGLAKEELAGVQAAADFVNADGGIEGRRIVLDVRDLESGTDAPAVMTALRAAGAAVVV